MFLGFGRYVGLSTVILITSAPICVPSLATVLSHKYYYDENVVILGGGGWFSMYKKYTSSCGDDKPEQLDRNICEF